MDDFTASTITILFTDIEGSTDLGRVKGDESARRIVRAHDDVVRTQIAEHRGRAVKSLGDGFMAAFSSARAAVACAVAIQQELDKRSKAGGDGFAPVRIGLNSGEVILENEDLFGAAVSAAARITAQAKGHQILASEIVKALVGTLPGITFEPAERVALKGFEEEWQLYEVAWRSEQSSRLRRTAFVGRETERAALAGYLNDLSKGSGALVLISGEPGVGKTRLAEEAARDASTREHRTLVGRCYDLDSPVPYLPFTELLEAAAKEVDPETFRVALGNAAGEIAKIMPQLRKLYDDIPPGLELPAEQERRYLFNSIVEFVERASSTRPLVLILDDLHWADESSLSVMQRVAQQLENLPVLMIGTYRDVELDVNRPLSRILDDLVRRQLANRIHLKRLSEEGVAAMLGKMAGREPPPTLVRAIYEETDGNAFFVEEVFRHLFEQNRLLDDQGQWLSSVEVGEVEVPESIRLVIGRRLEGLTDSARKALSTAAVVGRNFDYRLLEALESVDPDDLLDAMDEAQRLALVEPMSTDPTETRFEFAHELIRQTLLGGLALPRRQRLHLRVARTMEELYARELSERAGEIVNHLYRSATTDTRMIVKYLLLAGARAQQSAAFEDARRYYDDALGLTEGGDEVATAEALVGLGHAQRALADSESSLSSWRRALSIYEARGDHQAIAKVAHDIVMQLGWAGRWEELFEIASRALGVLGDEPTRERCLILSFAGIGLSWAGQYEAADTMIEQALELARRFDDNSLLGICLTSKGAHRYGYGFLEDCRECVDQAMELLRDTEDQWNYATALAFATMTAANTGRFDQVDDHARSLERLSERLGFGGGMMFANRSRIYGPTMAGIDLNRLEELTIRDLELCKAYDLPWIGQSHAFRARATYYKGNLEETLEHARLAHELDMPGVLRGFTLGILVLLLGYLGRREEALDLWDEVVAGLPEAGAENPLGSWILLGHVVEGLFMLEESERAAELYPLVLETSSTQTKYRFDGRPFEAVAALAAAAAENWEAMEDHFRRAFELTEQPEQKGDRVDMQRLHGMALMRKGDTQRARALLESALAGYRDMNVPVSAALTESILERIAS